MAPSHSTVEGVSPEIVGAIGQLPYPVLFIVAVAFIIWALTRRSNGNGAVGIHTIPPRVQPVVVDQKIGSISGDYWSEAKMIRDLGALEGTVQILKDSVDRQEENTKELTSKVDKLEVTMNYVPGQTAELVISHLRKSGLIKE